MRIFYFFDIYKYTAVTAFELMLWRISRRLEQKQAVLWLIIIAVHIIISWCNNLDYNIDSLIWRKIKQYVTPEVKWSPWMPQSAISGTWSSLSAQETKHIFSSVWNVVVLRTNTLWYILPDDAAQMSNHIYEHLLNICLWSQQKVKYASKYHHDKQKDHGKKIEVYVFPFSFFMYCLVALKRS